MNIGDEPEVLEPGVGVRSFSRRSQMLFAGFLLAVLATTAVVMWHTDASIRSQSVSVTNSRAAMKASRLAFAISGYEGALAVLSGAIDQGRSYCPLAAAPPGQAELWVADLNGDVLCSSPSSNQSELHRTGEPNRAAPAVSRTSGVGVLPAGGGIRITKVGHDRILEYRLSSELIRETIPTTDPSEEMALIGPSGDVLRVHSRPAGTRLTDADTFYTASAPVGTTDWRLTLRTDKAAVQAAFVGSVSVAYLPLVAALVLGGAVTFLDRFWLLAPVRRLLATAGSSAGYRSGRTSSPGPREVVEVGAAFEKIRSAYGTAQSKLAKAMTSLIRTREVERQQLATDLHDTAIQSLTLATWIIDDVTGISNMARASAGGEPGVDSEEMLTLASADLLRLKQAVTTAMTELRAATADLVPDRLHAEGLVPAVEALIRKIAVRDELPVAFVHDVEERPSQEVEIAAFRTIQEALHNVVKHAHASEARVHVTCDSVDLRGRVRDDGVGVTPERLVTAADGGHCGVVSMREALALAGGQFEIRPAGRGTAVDFRLPSRLTETSTPQDTNEDDIEIWSYESLAESLLAVEEELGTEAPQSLPNEEPVGWGRFVVWSSRWRRGRIQPSRHEVPTPV